MKYAFAEFSIRDLFTLIDENRVDLNPPYQRNFIWSPDNQKELIDTILKGYPLPSFFLFLKPDGLYEMVDGQQRSKTIYRFIKGEVTSTKEFQKKTFNEVDKEQVYSYRLPVIVISELSKDDSLQEFYVLINKKGVHLNPAEINKSEFQGTNFLKLSSDLLSYQNFIDLDLFTDAAAKRMNDRAFVEELLAFLLEGTKEKKKSVESVYEKDITNEQVEFLDTEFKNVIDKISNLCNLRHISKTRYKQKNDFYTLFSFISQNPKESSEILEYQYKVLLILDGEDSDGRQYIRPSNDECQALKEYANNCVTQSNSKKAREKRLAFFKAMLQNNESIENETLADVLDYFSRMFGREKVQLKRIGTYDLLDVDIL